jgi:chromosomal replication initiator protein
LVSAEYSFDNFIAGSSNLSAIKLGKRIVKRPGEEFPLVFFTGQSGVGKTHLMHAIYRELIGRKSIYLGTAKAFLEYFQVKCKTQGFARFIRDFVEKVEVLLLDDMEEAFVSKDFQHDFCHIYNHFSRLRRQIVLSGDCFSENVQNLFPKFESRIRGGVIQKISSMDEVLVLKLIFHKAKEEKLFLSDKTIKLLLKESHDNGRSIRAAILNLKASHYTQGDRPLVKTKYLSEAIIRNICKKYGVECQQVYGNSRRKDFVVPRHICMYILSRYMGFGLHKIGEVFDRDHTTVLYAVTKIEERIEKDLNFAGQVQGIFSEVTGQQFGEIENEQRIDRILH